MTDIKIYGAIIPDDDMPFYEWAGFEATSPGSVTQALNDAGGDDVVVYINSPGGDVVSASVIYDALMSYEGKVTIKITGLAASAASVVAMSGYCVMAPTALIMIHNPWTEVRGNSKELQKAAEDLEVVARSICNAYTLKTGMTEDEIREIMDNETWLDAKTAKMYNFVDNVAYCTCEDDAAQTPAAATYTPGLLTPEARARILKAMQQGTPGKEKEKEPEGTRQQTELNLLKLRQ